MENLDTKTLVHVGTELLLIGGLGFWMKKRIDTADAKVEEMEKKLVAFEEIINQQQAILAKHDAGLRQLFGMPPGPPPNPSPPGPEAERNPKGAAKAAPKESAKPAAKAAPKESAPKQKQPLSPTKEPEAQVSVIEEDDLSPEELDKILEKELKETTQRSSIEIDTAGTTGGGSAKALKQKRKVVTVRKKR